MCLAKLTVCPERAKEDIVVYKNLKRLRDCNTGKYIYKTPFQYVSVKLNSTMRSKFPTWFGIPKKYIGPEGIHAWLTKTELIFGNEVVVKCIIPKGTLYYKNEYGGDIASRKLYVTDEITEPQPWPEKQRVKIKQVSNKKKRKRAAKRR